MKSKYQVIYSLNENERIVFVGNTNLSIDDLLNSCDEILDASVEFNVESIIYEPVNPAPNESQKE